VTTGPLPPPGPHGGDAVSVAAALGLDPGGVLDLSQSLNPVAPDPLPVLRRHLRSVRRYPDPARATAALAETMGVDEGRLLLTNGGAEAIHLVSDEIGGSVVEPEFSLHPRGGGPRWRSNPHNPSGLLASRHEHAEVWDEAFYALATGTWTRGDVDAVVVGSLTKLLACPGLRIGYVLAPPGATTMMADLRRRQPMWAVNGLAASALPELLAQVDLARWCVEVAALRQRLGAVLRDHGLVPHLSDANWVLVEAPGLRDHLAPLGIVVRDCTTFGLPDVVRIAVPDPDGLDRLDEALSSIGPSRPGHRGAAASSPSTTASPVADGLGFSRQKGQAMTGQDFIGTCRRVGPVDPGAAASAAEHLDRLTKPRGSLGRLEEIGIRLCAIAGACPPPVPEPVTVAVFAGDHGVVAEGVTPWPQEVTAQMVANFCAGGAAINVLARHGGADVVVVDVGVATPIPTESGALVRRNVRRGTRNLAVEAAMTTEETLAALEVGLEVARRAVSAGSRLLVTGDMGIGNTTSAAALIAACTGRSAHEVTGRGTGIDDATLGHKQMVIERALARLASQPEPLVVLAELGGLEIAALCGFVVGAASSRVPVVVDGVIAAAATLVAVAFAPDVADYVVMGHRSSEPGSSAVLDELGLSPVLDLDMRLGEGTGAALAVPLVQAAAKILREMATFDSAGVSDKADLPS